MIDIDREELLTLSQAAATLPGRKAGKTMGASTVWRWTKAGCKGIKLETVMIGATAFTSREAIDRFIAALQGKTNPQEKTWTSAREKRRIEEERERAMEFLFPSRRPPSRRAKSDRK